MVQILLSEDVRTTEIYGRMKIEYGHKFMNRWEVYE